MARDIDWRAFLREVLHLSALLAHRTLFRIGLPAIFRRRHDLFRNTGFMRALTANPMNPRGPSSRSSFRSQLSNVSS